jgi:MFS family permease
VTRSTSKLPVPPSQQFPIVRNTLLLSGCMAVNGAGISLSAAVATITFVLVTGVEGLLGLGPAIFLTAAAGSAWVGGRAMDRHGRIPVLAVGFMIGIAGNLTTGLGVHLNSAAVVVVGLLGVGAGNGIINLTRTAGGDMYPPERRARGISYVLFGAVFGAILGPAVFIPLFSGREVEGTALVVAWCSSAVFLLVGLALALSVRPDPKRIAESFAPPKGLEDEASESAASLRTMFARPGVTPALLAAFASFSVMVSVMNLTGRLVVTDLGHSADTVFPIIAAHIVGMFALVVFVGDIIDRVGRRPALIGGLFVVGMSSLSLAWLEGVPAIAFALFALGLGWIFAFVAASTELVDRTRPFERGKLLGFNDTCSSLLSAMLALLGGFLLSHYGPGVLAGMSAAIALAPIPWIMRPSRDAAAPKALDTLTSR